MREVGGKLGDAAAGRDSAGSAAHRGVGTSWSIRTFLIFGILAIILVTVGTMALATYQTARGFLAGSYHDLARQLASEAVGSAEGLLNNARQAVISAKDSVEDGLLDVADQPKLAERLFEAVKRDQHLASLYVGSRNGDFVYVARESPRTNERFIVRIIKITGGERREYLELRDQRWLLLKTLEAETDDFLPYTRPWYRKALVFGDGSWTKPYIFYTSARPGISFARSLAGQDGDVLGVVGGDIELGEVSRFVANLRVGPHGAATIATSGGGEVNDGAVAERSAKPGGAPSVWSTLAPATHPGLAAMLRSLNERPPTAAQGLPETDRIVVDGVGYLAVATTFAATDLPWLLLVAMPESDYLGWFAESQRFTLIIAALVGVIGVLLSLLLWRRLAEPLDRLRANSAAVSAGRWKELTVGNSRFAEVRAAESAFMSMAAMLGQQERTNRSLLRRLGKLAAAVEQSATAVFIVDAKGRVEFANRAFELLTGHDQEEIIGRSAISLLAQSDDQASLEEVRRSLADGKAWRGERLVRRVDGSEFTAVFTAAPVRNPAGVAAHAVVAMEDVTLVRAHERAIAEALDVAVAANQTRTEFLAHMSHDLRTPLNAILGFSEIMRAELFGPIGDQRYAEYVRDIQNSGEYLLSIVDQILEIARADSTSVALHDDEAPLEDLIQSVCRLVADQATSRRIDVAVSPAPGVRLRCDATKLQQALVNLVANAIKFTLPGGRVEITTARPAAGGVEIRIADTGVGMTPQQVEVALQPFMRVNNNPYTRNADGVGLGLPIAQRLVQLHGGMLSIDSVPGVGTVVIVRLPQERLLAEG